MSTCHSKIQKHVKNVGRNMILLHSFTFLFFKNYGDKKWILKRSITLHDECAIRSLGI